MTNKKIGLWACMGLILALAVPTTAAGNVWTHGEAGEPLSSSASVTLSGTLSYTSENLSISCSEVDMGTTLTPGTTGHVESLTIPPLKCILKGLLAGCQLQKVEPTKLFWPIDLKLKDIEITSYITHFYFQGFLCPAKITVEGLHTATPDKLRGITRVTLGGKVKLSIGGEAIVGGEMNVSPSGTYGLE
jgi:hypothetical protein